MGLTRFGANDAGKILFFDSNNYFGKMNAFIKCLCYTYNTFGLEAYKNLKLISEDCQVNSKDVFFVEEDESIIIIYLY